MLILTLKILFAVLCTTGCWLDYRSRTLPNWLCGALFITGITYAALSGGVDLALLHLAHAGIALLVWMGIFALGIVGGGDAKFYTGAAAWFALSKGLTLLLWVSVSGLMLFALWFLFRRLRGIPISRKATGKSDKLPYGIAIAVGAAITMFM